MNLCCIRDDDVNAFTRPEDLQRVYGPLLQEGLAVNFSVIPAARCDTQLRRDDIYRVREGLRHHPFIPAACRGVAETVEIGDNAALCRFLRALPNAEILQHGYDHGLIDGRRECEEPDTVALEQRVMEGRRLLETALGRRPRFFVPPWDAFHRPALRMLRRHFDGVSVRSLGRSHLPVWQRWRYLRFRREGRSHFFWGRFLILEHPGYLSSRFAGPDLEQRIHALLDHQDVLVLVHHHWECLWPGEETPAGFLERWRALLDDLMASRRVNFVTFSELRERLRRGMACA